MPLSHFLFIHQFISHLFIHSFNFQFGHSFILSFMRLSHNLTIPYSFLNISVFPFIHLSLYLFFHSSPLSTYSMFSRERKIFQQKMKAVYGAFIFERDIKAIRQVAIDVDRSFEDDNIKPAKWLVQLHTENS